MASNSYVATGLLVVKEDTVKKTETFSVREFVIEVAGDRFSDFVKFQLSNDKCLLIDSFQLGEMVEVSFNVRGRKWEKDGKVSYFNSLDAWRLKKADGTGASATMGGSSAAGMPASAPVFTSTEVSNQQDGGDLPF